MFATSSILSQRITRGISESGGIGPMNSTTGPGGRAPVPLPLNSSTQMLRNGKEDHDGIENS